MSIEDVARAIMDPNSSLPKEIDVEHLEAAFGLAPLSPEAQRQLEVRTVMGSIPGLEHPEVRRLAVERLREVDDYGNFVIPAASKIDSAEGLRAALQEAVNQIRSEVDADIDAGFYEDRDELVQALTEEAEALREDREALELEEVRESVAADLEAYLVAHPDLPPPVYELASAIALDRPGLSVEETMNAAQRAFSEVARLAGEANSDLGIYQRAVKDIPLLEDVEFIEPLKSLGEIIDGAVGIIDISPEVERLMFDTLGVTETGETSVADEATLDEAIRGIWSGDSGLSPHEEWGRMAAAAKAEQEARARENQR